MKLIVAIINNDDSASVLNLSEVQGDAVSLYAMWAPASFATIRLCCKENATLSIPARIICALVLLKSRP